MKYLIMILIVILGALIYYFRPILNIFYLCIRYGVRHFDEYLTADIKKFTICKKYTARRDDLIKFLVPELNIYVEGKIIGLSKDNKVYVLEKDGNTTTYKLSFITDSDLIYLK